jgi:hypothetical protein
MKRQPDGTFRNVRQPTVVSAAVFRARWIEGETIHLKRIGLPFEAIAEHITRVARGEAKAMTAIPDGVTFPPDFKISRQACHKAFRRAITREPALEVDELRRLDRARSEEMYLSLQPGIRKGDPRSVEVGLRLLDHAAKINGYAAPQKDEVTGKDGSPLRLIPIELARRVLEEVENEK